MPEERPPILRAEDGGPYRNANEFLRLRKAGRLLPGQLIRVHNYGGPAANERLYVIGPDKELYSKGKGPFNPRKVLSGKAAQDGWAFDGRGGLENLPESKLKEILDIREASDPPQSASRVAEMKKRLGIQEAVD